MRIVPVHCTFFFSFRFIKAAYFSRAASNFFRHTMAVDIPKFETFDIKLHPTGVAEIIFNRPERYNALSRQAYAVSCI
jgi:hypothetical protein